MITIKMQAGLGNQLFQYALYCSMKERGKKVCLDDSWYNKDLPDYKKKAIQSFQVDYEKMPAGTYPNYIRDESNRFNMLIKKFNWSKRLYVEKQSGLYDPKVFELDDIYLDGYWQTEKYFFDCSKIIKKNLTYSKPLNEQNFNFIEQMKKSNSISIHVRRGDYISSGYKNKYGGICDELYYRNAINYVINRIPDPVFFIFSDDIAWCKKFFQGSTVFVDNNTGTEAYLDMVLMSHCKHHIIANSSFSWWGAYLSKEQGLTIAPTRWQNSSEMPDIWCDDWIRI